MSLPGEQYAWEVIESPLYSSTQKAQARIRLAEIERIKRANEESYRRYMDGKKQPYKFCPHCGGEL